MINDRFNGGSKNDFKGRFRDRKFVSAVAIGIFLLILVIVLVAKGCSTRRPRTTQIAPPTLTQPEDDTPPRQELEEDEGRRLLREGREYYNGDAGRTQSYVEAQKCFLEAKKLGVKDADIWLKKCEKKLAPPAPQKSVKPAPTKPAKNTKKPAKNTKKKK